LIPCLCTRSCFAPALFLKPCNRAFSLLSTLDGIYCSHMDGSNLVPYFPIESTSSPPIRMISWQVAVVPTIYNFCKFSRTLRFGPWVTRWASH
jgi:hypothetical protein